ncbi:hypothetical protein BDZ97DRAFT_103734 [Flammula alnicola]|nr:hypothetical protein BDZ97DRAFT_103734 [Flammula alnicola]
MSFKQTSKQIHHASQITTKPSAYSTPRAPLIFAPSSTSRPAKSSKRLDSSIERISGSPRFYASSVLRWSGGLYTMRDDYSQQNQNKSRSSSDSALRMPLPLPPFHRHHLGQRLQQLQPCHQNLKPSISITHATSTLEPSATDRPSSSEDEDETIVATFESTPTMRFKMTTIAHQDRHRARSLCLRRLNEAHGVVEIQNAERRERDRNSSNDAHPSLRLKIEALQDEINLPNK